jgi:hypothetical protein
MASNRTMNTTLSFDSGNRMGSGGYKFFLYFLFLISLSQLFFDYVKPVSILFLLISFLLIGVVAVRATKIDLLFFMFFTMVMNIVIPITTDKTFSQVVPFLFFLIILAKSRLLRIKKIDFISLSMVLYFLILLISVLRGIKLPGFETGNTGFLARWNLLNTFFVFMATLLSFKVDSFPNFLKRFYKLFLMILIISLVIFYFNITFKLPLFNTFSWSVIYEGAGSKRMGIAGLAAIYIFIYFLCFNKSRGLFTNIFWSSGLRRKINDACFFTHGIFKLGDKKKDSDKVFCSNMPSGFCIYRV